MMNRIEYNCNDRRPEQPHRPGPGSIVSGVSASSGQAASRPRQKGITTLFFPFVQQATDRHHITVNLMTGLQVSEEHRHLRQGFGAPSINLRDYGRGLAASQDLSQMPVLTPTGGFAGIRAPWGPGKTYISITRQATHLGTPTASEKFPRQWVEVTSSRLLGISPVGHDCDCDGSVGRFSCYRQHQRQVVERSLSTPQCSPLRRYR